MKKRFISIISSFDQLVKNSLRYGLVIVFLWIGGLKFFTYEADGIVPFVAQNPIMSFMYKHPSDYKIHMYKEGEMININHQWNIDNNTYVFADALGAFLIVIAGLIALHKVVPFASMIASILIFFMTIGTLSFLLTTPESWVPQITDKDFGFPFLSGRGRLLIKDIVILGAAIITMSESASLYLRRPNL